MDDDRGPAGRDEGEAGQAAAQRDGAVRVRPDRVVLLPVLLTLLGALPLALSAPWLTWLLLVPLAAGVWVLRARVVAGDRGVLVCNGLGMRRVGWDAVEGVSVPRRGPLRLLVRGRRPLLLSALSRRDLPRVLAAGERAAAGPPPA